MRPNHELFKTHEDHFRGRWYRPQNKEERKSVDLAIRQATHQKKDEKCNIVWKEVKNWIQDEKKKTRLTNSLKE